MNQLYLERLRRLGLLEKFQHREDFELMHYGVKGMKWGVRRSKEQLRYDIGSIHTVLNRRLPGIKTPNGVHAKEVSIHALDRIGTRDDRKVTAKQIINALENPIHINKMKVDGKGRRSIQYVGNDATAVLNPDNGVVVTVWKTGTSERNKYPRRRY